MSESYGGDYIYTTLTNDTDVTAIVSTEIYNSRMIPAGKEKFDTINFYRSVNWDRSQEVFRQEWSIDCRSKSQATSEQLAFVVSEAFNRVSGTEGSYKYFGVCSVLPSIPPQDDSDVYNTPVQFTLRRH